MIVQLFLLLGMGFVLTYLTYNLYFNKQQTKKKYINDGVKLGMMLPGLMNQLAKRAQVMQNQTRPIMIARPTKITTSPMQGTCGPCKTTKPIFMPFKCRYCESIYCENHRIPENHSCDGI